MVVHIFDCKWHFQTTNVNILFFTVAVDKNILVTLSYADLKNECDSENVEGENKVAKFCGKCGSRLDEKTALCPKCDAEKIKNKHPKNQVGRHKEINSENKKAKRKAESSNKKSLKKLKKRQRKEAKKAKKKQKWASFSFGQKLRKILQRIVLWIAIMFLVVSVALTGLTYHGFMDISFISNMLQKIGLEEKESKVGYEEDYKVTPPDAKAYFSNNSKILKETEANESANVRTEAETCDDMMERGFTEYPIVTEYSMNGEFFDSVEVDVQSTVKHPIYQTEYFSESRELWEIIIVNGMVMANPVSYNIQSGLEVQVIISEHNSITSYDSTTNKFYETIPNKSALLVIIVDRIDAETIDGLTKGEIDHYVQ